MPSDACPYTLFAVHPVLAARTWRRLFWCGRVLTSLVWRLGGIHTRDYPRDYQAVDVLRSEILYTSALVGSDALALTLSLPW